MALAFAARSDIDVHIFHDERSLRSPRSGSPWLRARRLFCCAPAAPQPLTSMPQSSRPISRACRMFVLTADRPPELHGVGAPQTIEQTDLYGDAVRWFHDPGVPVDEHAVVASLASLRGRRRRATDQVRCTSTCRSASPGRRGLASCPTRPCASLISPPLLVLDDLVDLLGAPAA